MARCPRLLFLPVLVLALAATCSDRPRAPEEAAGGTSEAASPGGAVLQFDTTASAAFVVHRPTGRRHLLFEDETVEGSEEGTFYRLLSSFGPYVSYRTEWYYEGGAHPSYGITYDAVTVGETVEEADLRRLFSEAALYTAMLQTELVRQTSLTHTTLTELLDGLATTYECRMSFEGFFSSFYVKQVRDGVADVVVGLSHGCEVERGAFTRFTLTMNIAEDQKTLFDDLHVFYEE